MQYAAAVKKTISLNKRDKRSTCERDSSANTLRKSHRGDSDCGRKEARVPARNVERCELFQDEVTLNQAVPVQPASRRLPRTTPPLLTTHLLNSIPRVGSSWIPPWSRQYLFLSEAASGDMPNWHKKFSTQRKNATSVKKPSFTRFTNRSAPTGDQS